jgi:NADH:ubiquinone oxidoreductase subunit E
VDQATVRAIEDVLANVRRRPDGLAGILPVLLNIEAAVGYVPQDSVACVARALGVTDAQVAGVLSYYPDLHTSPRGRHVVRVCMGEACLANHGGRVLQAVRDHLRIGVGETASGGVYSLEQVYCVGNCGVSPSLVVDETLYGRVTPEQVPALLERKRQEGS